MEKLGAEALFAAISNGIYGHVCVQFGDAIVLWGGFNEKQRYLDSNYISVYSSHRRKWIQLLTKGDIPIARTSPVALVIDRKMYITCGFREENVNTTVTLDFDRLEWKNIESQSKLPSPRDKHCGWSMNEKIYIFGGYGPDLKETTLCFQEHGEFQLDESSFSFGRGWNNQLLELDCSQQTWKCLETSGDVPVPRAASGAAVCNNRGYLYGGRSGDQRLDDLYEIDFEMRIWTRIPYSNGPCGRSWLTMTTVNNGRIFLYGGMDSSGKVLSDSWLLDTHDNKWTLWRNETPRMWHASCCDGDGNVVSMGGTLNSVLDDGDTEFATDVLTHQLEPKRLYFVCLEFVASSWNSFKSPSTSLPKRIFDELLRVVHKSL